MDVLDDVRARDRKDVPVVQDVLLVVAEALPTRRGLIEHALVLIPANRRPHGPVDDEDALAHGGFEFSAAIGAGRHGRN
jgi:hypothetical protein